MVMHSGIGMTSLRTRSRLIDRLRAEGIHDERVLAQIAQLPRHLFVDEALASRAYEDTALPIGQGQTISQPFVVAKMTESVLNANPGGARVLEIGTGSGYQTAVLAGLFKTVCSVERIRALLSKARRRLLELGIRNVKLRHGDGYHGWDQAASFDAILLTAAPAAIPPPLFEQLAVGGCLVAPVGAAGGQVLMRYVKYEEHVEEESLGAVSFVPFGGGKA